MNLADILKSSFYFYCCTAVKSLLPSNAYVG